MSFSKVLRNTLRNKNTGRGDECRAASLIVLKARGKYNNFGILSDFGEELKVR